MFYLTLYQTVLTSWTKCSMKSRDCNLQYYAPYESPVLDGLLPADQQKAAEWFISRSKAIYNLLRPEGGDYILLFLAWIPIYDVLYKVRESPKWFQYMQDIESFTCLLHYAYDRVGLLSEILKQFKFSDCEVEIRDKIYVYETEQLFRDNMKVVNPYLDRVPLSLYQEYMDDFVQAATDLGLSQDHDNGEDIRFPIPYKLALMYGKKLTTIQ